MSNVIVVAELINEVIEKMQQGSKHSEYLQDQLRKILSDYTSLFLDE